MYLSHEYVMFAFKYRITLPWCISDNLWHFSSTKSCLKSTNFWINHIAVAYQLPPMAWHLSSAKPASFSWPRVFSFAVSGCSYYSIALSPVLDTCSKLQFNGASEREQKNASQKFNRTYPHQWSWITAYKNSEHGCNLKMRKIDFPGYNIENYF